MYFLNALHLKQFYSSDLGKQVSKRLKQVTHKTWPHNDDETILAIGYPTPIWERDKAPNSLIVAMPAEQGAVRWPKAEYGASKTIVTHDAELPLPSNSINRVILLHSLETSPNISALMKEIYRVLVPNGRVMLIAPNRLGLWSRSSNSPFGYGRPFSIQEIKSLLEHHELTFKRRRTWMFMPPTHNRFLLRAIRMVEFLGEFFLPMCGGIHLVEAEKQIYASVMQPGARKARSSVKRPATVAAPTQMNRE